MWRFLTFCAIGTFFVVTGESWDCNDGNGSGTISGVNITECDVKGGEICSFKSDQTVTLMIQFTIDHNVSEAGVMIVARNEGTFGIPIFTTLDLDDTDVCQDSNSGLSCPLSANETYSYTKTFDLTNVSVTRNETTEFEVYIREGNNTESFVCLGFEAVICD